MTTRRIRIALVSCAAQKLAEPARARDLYVSDLFRKSWRYAERHADRVFVLSAAHGVVAADTVLAPYDVTLAKMPAADVRAWGKRVAEQLVELVRGLNVDPADVELLVLGGARYTSFQSRFESALPGVRVVLPLDGLEIGQRLAFLKRANEAAPANPVVAAREASMTARAAFDSACTRRENLHLVPGYGRDRAADKQAALDAAALVESARFAFRAAVAAYQLALAGCSR